MTCVLCGKVCGPLKGETKSWRCAGLLAGQRKTANRIRAIITNEQGKYDSPGKANVRELVVAVAAADCTTVLDLWGGGQSARMFAAAGLNVTSAEITRSLHAALKADAAEYGYTAWPRRAGRVNGMFDFVFADFCAGASPPTSRELKRLVPHVGKLMAVTLAPDHQKDVSLTGPMAAYTVPAWLVGATGLDLEYIVRYVRNENKQTMWFALLSRPTRNHGTQHLVLPTIARELVSPRRYWATPAFRLSFGDVVPHRTSGGTDRQKKRQHERYEEKREELLAKSREWYQANREQILAKQRAKYTRDPELAREYEKRWRATHPPTPEQQERRRAYRKQWYADNRSEQIEAVRRWKAKNPERARELAREHHRRSYAANPEKTRERHRRWRAANPEKDREQNRASQSRQRAAKRLALEESKAANGGQSVSNTLLTEDEFRG